VACREIEPPSSSAVPVAEKLFSPCRHWSTGHANSASRASSSPSKRIPATFWQTPQASGGTSLISQAQRRALGIRPNAQGKYPVPTQPTFCRLLQRVDARKVEEVILAIQNQVRGPAPKEHLIVFDGKQPKHGGGASVLSVVTVPSQHYLGNALVDQKTNEIPVARELFKRLELEGRLVSLDALHTQDETARALVLEHGADYLLTVKGNQPTVRQQIEKLLTAAQLVFSPQEPKSTQANSQEINKSRKESRSIVTAPVSAEEVCFPLAEQAAVLLRQTEGRKDELVTLISSLEPSRLDAENWLRLNRDAWGIESGLHQRLDISHNDDRCRVRNHNAI
jgi:predicted transposase YbfD/YdcC